MGVFTEDNIVDGMVKIALPNYMEDALLVEDFTIPYEFVKRGAYEDLHFTKGTLISFYECKMPKYNSGFDKIYVNLRLLKKNNKGNDSPLVAKQFQVYILGLDGIKYKKVNRDSHLLAKSRQEKIDSLFN
jgi:hypothetical protein